MSYQYILVELWTSYRQNKTVKRLVLFIVGMVIWSLRRL